MLKLHYWIGVCVLLDALRILLCAALLKCPGWRLYLLVFTLGSFL